MARHAGARKGGKQKKFGSESDTDGKEEKLGMDKVRWTGLRRSGLARVDAHRMAG
jgi:hypothetical protein